MRIRKLSKNKKAMELSINFIVMLVLAIVTFSLAIYLTYSIFAKSYQFKSDVDAQTKAQIRNLLDSGEKVAIPVGTLDIRNGKGDVFGLGIINTESGGTNTEPQDYWVKIVEVDTDGSAITSGTNAVKVYDIDGNAVDDSEAKQSAAGIKLIFIKKIEALGINEQRVALIQAKVGDDVKSGLVYSYTVKVYKNSQYTGSTYGFPQKIYIHVP